MEKAGLLVEPEFDNPELYLQEGVLTKQTELIRSIANRFKGTNQEEALRNLLIFLNYEVEVKRGVNDPKKFNKTAEQILVSRQRTGCSDSAILFATIARAMGIPSMLVVTFDKGWREKIVKGIDPEVTEGHFFVASKITEGKNAGNWVLIDTHNNSRNSKFLKFEKLDLENRNIPWKKDKSMYAFAYVRDIRDIRLNGRTVDNSSNMRYVQVRAALSANGKDIVSDDILR